LEINPDFSRKVVQVNYFALICVAKLRLGQGFVAPPKFSPCENLGGDKALDSLSSGERKGKSPNLPCPSDKEIRSTKYEFRNNDQNSNVQMATPSLLLPLPEGGGGNRWGRGIRFEHLVI